jgi:hypothetical protein
MRKIVSILFFSLFTSVITNAQNDKLNYLKSIGDNDPIFETDTFPAKWKNESAVILADKLVADLYEATPMVGYRAQHRTRILLLDAAAVKDFSFFYFDEDVNKKIKKDKDYYTFDSLQILVKKANGTIKLVDLKTAIKEEQVIKIPELYKRRYFKTSSYYKIAIANLEPGDIIDFCTTRKILFPIDYVINSISFPDIDYTLDDVYHTVKHKLVVKSPTKAKANKFGFTMLYLNTYNGAPPIKQEIINEAMVCSLEASLLPKSKYERWQFPFLSVPSVKGYLTYVNASERNLNMYKQYPNAVPWGRTSVVNMDHIYTTMNFNTLYSEYIWYSDVKNTVNQSWEGGGVRSYLSENYPGIHDPVKIAKVAFYYLRNMSLEKNWNYDNENFIGLMKQVLDVYHIKYTHLVTVPRSHSTLKDVLLRDDLHVLLKFKVEGEWEDPEVDEYIYLSNVDNYLNFGELETKYQGNEAYEYTKSPASIKKVTLPVIDYKANSLLEKATYTIAPDLETLSAENEVTIKGSIKKYYNDSLVFRNEYERYDMLTFRDSTHVFDPLDEAKEKEMAKLHQKEKINFRKNDIERTIPLQSYDDFKLIQDGRVYDKQELIFNEKYTAKELIANAGSKHLFSIGKLIGGQAELEESETKRMTDIYMDAARFFQYDITIVIPDGYALQNIEKLNINVTNETGSFSSVAKLENNKLTLLVSKIYYHNFEKKEDWPKMIAFLDACYNFTQTKVLLVKK